MPAFGARIRLLLETPQRQVIAVACAVALTAIALETTGVLPHLIFIIMFTWAGMLYAYTKPAWLERLLLAREPRPVQKTLPVAEPRPSRLTARRYLASVLILVAVIFFAARLLGW